jgi:hypothetical protein
MVAWPLTGRTVCPAVIGRHAGTLVTHEGRA